MLLYIGGVLVFGSATLAEDMMARELTLSQIKITGDEFVVLRNSTASNLNLGNFWLQYYNDFNLSNQGLSNSSMQLPSVTLQPGQEILLAVGAAANCGQVWVSKLSFSLKDSAGLLQVLSVSQTSGYVSYRSEDQISWSSKSTDPVDIKGLSSSALAQIWYKPGNIWLSTNSPPGCTAVGGVISSATNTPASLTRSNSSPPAIVLGATATSSSTGFSEANAGLIAPQISELLPNPAPPQTDAADEFIELYNPNNAQFDLSGFILRTGISTYHNFTFPSGQFILQPHEFRAFFAPQTGISLSNTSGQAALLSPAGDVLAQTDLYETAKENYAWIYSDGLWQWTTSPTPNAVNAIQPPIDLKSTSKPKTAKTSVLKSSKTAKSTTSKNGVAVNGQSNSFSDKAVHHSLINSFVLAVGVGIAVVYGLYEYRNDLANQLYKFKRYRELRRVPRQTT